MKPNNWFYIRFCPTFIFVIRISRTKRLMYSRARGWKVIGLEHSE